MHICEHNKGEQALTHATKFCKEHLTPSQFEELNKISLPSDIKNQAQVKHSEPVHRDKPHLMR